MPGTQQLKDLSTAEVTGGCSDILSRSLRGEPTLIKTWLDSCSPGLPYDGPEGWKMIFNTQSQGDREVVEQFSASLVMQPTSDLHLMLHMIRPHIRMAESW